VQSVVHGAFGAAGQLVLYLFGVCEHLFGCVSV
jgi:hypothetical protein